MIQVVTSGSCRGVVSPRLLDKVEGYSGCGFGVEERLMGHPVIERLMRALVVVVVDVAGDLGAGLLNVLEPVEPGAFLFEGAVEPLAEAVLLRGIGRDVFLLQRGMRDRKSTRLNPLHLGIWYDG